MLNDLLSKAHLAALAAMSAVTDFLPQSTAANAVVGVWKAFSEYSVFLYLGYVGLGLLILVLVAQSPLYPLYALSKFQPGPLPVGKDFCLLSEPYVLSRAKSAAQVNFFRSWGCSLLAFLPDILAPVVVPFALLFTSWKAETLPSIFRWWDNDASINGDIRTDDPYDGLGGWALWPVPLDKSNEEAIRRCYWAPGHHPRSFFARWVWLGLRNRASYLNVAFGKQFGGMLEVATNEGEDGSSATLRYGISTSGRPMLSLMVLKPLGPFVLRSYYGYKIPNIPGEPMAKIATVGFSLKRNRAV